MATPPFLIPYLVLTSKGLVKLVGLWVVVSIQSEHVHGVVLPDQPRYAGVYMKCFYPINLVTQLLEDIFAL